MSSSTQTRGYTFGHPFWVGTLINNLLTSKSVASSLRMIAFLFPFCLKPSFHAVIPQSDRKRAFQEENKFLLTDVEDDRSFSSCLTSLFFYLPFWQLIFPHHTGIGSLSINYFFFAGETPDVKETFVTRVSFIKTGENRMTHDMTLFSAASFLFWNWFNIMNWWEKCAIIWSA